MSAVRGFATTVLGLVALEVVVSTQGAADRTAGLLGGAAGIIDAIFNPTIPAIRDRSGTIDGSGGTTSAGEVGKALGLAGGNLKTHKLKDGSTFHQATGDPNNPATYDPPYVTPPTRPTTPPATPSPPVYGKVTT